GRPESPRHLYGFVLLLLGQRLAVVGSSALSRWQERDGRFGIHRRTARSLAPEESRELLALRIGLRSDVRRPGRAWAWDSKARQQIGEVFRGISLRKLAVRIGLGALDVEIMIGRPGMASEPARPFFRQGFLPVAVETSKIVVG